MSDRQLRRVLKGAFREEARRMANVAKRNLRSTTLSHAASIATGIRAGVKRGLIGYYVSVTPEKWSRKKYRAVQAAKAKGKIIIRKGIYTNTANNERPVLMWAENGTKNRESRGRGVFERNRGHMFGKKGLPEGEGLGFLKRAEATETGVSVSRVADSLDRHVRKIATKYGML